MFALQHLCVGVGQSLPTRSRHCKRPIGTGVRENLAFVDNLQKVLEWRTVYAVLVHVSAIRQQGTSLGRLRQQGLRVPTRPFGHPCRANPHANRIRFAELNEDAVKGHPLHVGFFPNDRS